MINYLKTPIYKLLLIQSLSNKELSKIKYDLLIQSPVLFEHTVYSSIYPIYIYIIRILMNNISKKKIQQPENKLTALLKILINLKFKNDCLKKYIQGRDSNSPSVRD